MLVATAAIAALLTTPREVLVNKGWLFHREETPESSQEPYGGPNWETVNLPHCVRLEDDTQPKVEWFQGRAWYQKSFIPQQSWSSKRVALRFEGAMQAADAWVNGKHRLRHTGGYLPFELDLTKDTHGLQPIVVTLLVDNRDDKSFPPGRPQNALDFTYAGGLYRNVWLEVTPKQFISNVYATATEADRGSATVAVQATVTGGDSLVKVALVDPQGKTICEDTCAGAIEFRVPKPKLWDLDHPFLYHAVVSLADGSDSRTVRFGIRKLEFDHAAGVRLNGKTLRLEGSNRHMGYPIIGNAASDAAQYREAKKLKSLGLNILRLAHYPQAPAFLDACDELGILVIDPIPGWQLFNNTHEFKQHVLRDVRETVVRDRNHPCVAIFETCLNETYSAPDSFWLECSRVAHETFGRGNFFTGGDSYGKRDTSRPIWDVPWTGWDDEQFSRPALFKMQRGIDREYGDYEFGGEQSTSRADRGDGEGALMLQAWNFIWSHNRNRGNSWSFGDLTWEAIDTYRGLNPEFPVSKSGLLDLFRVPKPVAWFYSSQGSVKPMVHIANRWDDRPSPTKVVVFSNCDEVALRLNGKEIARHKPDSGPTTGYIGPKTADPNYWAHGSGEIIAASSVEEPVGGNPGALPFSGGNCQNLSHPPFTFDGVPYSPGTLEAVGYRGGLVAAKHTICTPSQATHLAINVDTQGRPLMADGADFVFVTVEVQDANGQVVPDSKVPIRLGVTRGEVLGAVERHATAGVASFMIRAAAAGSVRLVASCPGLKTGRATTLAR